MTNYDELRRLEGAATKAPWTIEEDDTSRKWVNIRSSAGFVLRPDGYQTSRYGELETEYGARVKPEDAALIAAARNALPALLDENERLRAALKRWGTWAHAPIGMDNEEFEAALAGTPEWAFPDPKP